jgi:hypothetical protein
MFGETLFGGSRFIFWTLAPAVFLALLILNTTQVEWTPTRAAIVAAMDLGGALFVLGLYDNVRFRWASRALCAEVFLLYLAYLIYEWGFSRHPFQIVERRSVASPRNALLGFAIIGIPSLAYAVTGSFRPWRRQDEVPHDGDDAD